MENHDGLGVWAVILVNEIQGPSSVLPVVCHVPESWATFMGLPDKRQLKWPICQLAPWDMIGIDWLTVSPKAIGGGGYVHVVVDHFSRNLRLRAATNANPVQVCALEELFRGVWGSIRMLQ